MLLYVLHGTNIKNKSMSVATRRVVDKAQRFICLKGRQSDCFSSTPIMYRWQIKADEKVHCSLATISGKMF